MFGFKGYAVIAVAGQMQVAVCTGWVRTMHVPAAATQSTLSTPLSALSTPAHMHAGGLRQ